MPNIKKIKVSRSQHLDGQRCLRLRWLGYSEGPTGMGIAPVKKSIHLVLGGAVHAGLEVLLRESQTWMNGHPGCVIDVLFTVPTLSGISAARDIEDHAVEAALAEFTAMSEFGVELDSQEILNVQQAAGVAGEMAAVAGGRGDSPIAIDFGGLDLDTMTFKEQLVASVALEQAKGQIDNVVEQVPEVAATGGWGEIIYMDKPKQRAEPVEELQQAALMIEPVMGQPPSQSAGGFDDYLKQELMALVEGMVRGYARRRLRPLLEQFEVLEVEREGEWKLGEGSYDLGHDWPAPTMGIPASKCSRCGQQSNEAGEVCPLAFEIWFMSRHDALLRERSTDFLYLMSYKTTGAWDRRREQDAQIDMQGLSEAVDVENRLGRAWTKIHTDCQEGDIYSVYDDVNQATLEWLGKQYSMPKILGVRYEYLIKGPRRQDKNDPQMPGRYVADSPLIRAYKQDGITLDDRRWATSYDWYDIAGKTKRLDYRSWKKAPVWKTMSIARWIDMLDRGEVQPEALDAMGNHLDALSEQLATPITVYRNEDDMRDMLEQLEAEEIRIAADVAAVRAVEHDPVLKRSELNRRFSQSRKSCSYPGRCSMYDVCYGSYVIRQDPLSSGLYQIRTANHPQELQG